LWSVLALIFVALFVVYSPSMMNVKNPNSNPSSEELEEPNPTEIIQQIDNSEN